MIRCPYGDCPFYGSQDEVDDHVDYLIGVQDPEHDEVARRRR